MLFLWGWLSGIATAGIVVLLWYSYQAFQTIVINRKIEKERGWL